MSAPASYAYQGIAQPGDGSHPFNADVFRIQQLLNKRHTLTIAKVVGTASIVEYGSAEPIKSIDVLPLVNEVTGGNQPVPHSTVYGVPYLRSQGGGNAFINDPVVGDIGIFAVAEADISSALATGTQSNPGSGRRNNYADGMYLGSIKAGAPTQWFSWLAKGFNLTDAYGNTIIGTAAGVLINGCLINLAGDVITKAGTDLDMHLHTLVMTGADLSGPPPT